MQKHVAVVINLMELHRETWRDQPEDYWLARLMQEMGELAGALVESHQHTPDHELKQIAAICLNWLDMRDGEN